jgi:hypothetical protein
LLGNELLLLEQELSEISGLSGLNLLNGHLIEAHEED